MDKESLATFSFQVQRQATSYLNDSENFAF